MIKEYRKTATIKAEQFDGSEEMIKKYNLGFWKGQDTGEVYEYSIPTKEGVLDLNVGDWIATGVEGEHWAIANEIFKKTYEEVKNDQGDMQYVHLSDTNGKNAYIEATFYKMRDTEQVKYIYRAYAAGGQYEDYEEYEIGFSFDRNKVLTMIDKFIAKPSLYRTGVFEYISVQRFGLDEFDPLDPDKGYKMDDLYEVDYSSDQYFVKTEQKYWDKFLNDEVSE